VKIRILDPRFANSQFLNGGDERREEKRKGDNGNLCHIKDDLLVHQEAAFACASFAWSVIFHEISCLIHTIRMG
jgi:hypothetical protein